MLISELTDSLENNHIIKIEDEKDFERFSRITSIHKEGVCIFIMDLSYMDKIPNNARMIISTQEIIDEIKKNQIDTTSPYGFCISTNPKVTYFMLLNKSFEIYTDAGKKTVIGDNCKISEKAYIADVDVVIGNNVVIEDSVTINDGVEIGDNTVIHAGSRIAIQDFNFFSDEGMYYHIKHLGRVKIGKNVYIGYNSVVGKSLYHGDETVIGDNSIIGNLCAIGHDTIIGKHTMVYAGSTVAGFCNIGSNVRITMNCVLKNGISIGDGATVGMGSSVLRSVRAGDTVMGNPARVMGIPARRISG